MTFFCLFCFQLNERASLLFHGKHLLLLVLVVIHLRALGEFPVSGRAEFFAGGTSDAVCRVLTLCLSLGAALHPGKRRRDGDERSEDEWGQRWRCEGWTRLTCTNTLQQRRVRPVQRWNRRPPQLQNKENTWHHGVKEKYIKQKNQNNLKNYSF